MAKKDKKAAKEVRNSLREQPVSKPIVKDSFYRRHLYSIIIFSFSFLLFANSIPNGYNLDDELVTNNHHLTSKGISAIPEIFSSPYYNDGHYAYEYRPIVLTTFAIEHSLFGDNPYMSHFINVLLYSLCSIVLFKTLRRLFPGIHPLFHLAVTLLFVAHPSHTEVVCNIKCRDEILALLFSLLALDFSIRFAREKKWWLMPVVIILYGLALLNKLTIISFAVIIPLTLILFTDASLATVILLSALLILTSLPLVNLSSFLQKMMLGIGLLLSTVVAYIYIKPGGLFSFFKKNPAVDVSDKIDQDALYKPGTGRAPLLNGTRPGHEIFSFNAAILPVIFSALSLVGLFLHINALLIGGGAVLFILSIIANQRISWWATLFFYLLTIIALIQFPLGKTFYNDLIAMALVYHVFFGRRDFAIPALLLYTFQVVLNIDLYSNWNTLFYFVLFFSLRWKYAWPIAGMILLMSAFSPINYLANVRFAFVPHLKAFTIYTVYYGGALAVLMSILMYFKHSLLRPLALVFSVSGLAILFYFQVTQAKEKSQVTTPLEAQKFVQSVNTTIVPGKMNRPLEFIEQPVNVNAPVSLKLGTSAEILLEYLHKTILPYPLSFYYGYRFIEPINANSPIAIISLILYALLLVLALWLLKKNKIPGYALLFYLISIVVFSNFLQPAPGLLADRFMLVPSIGWCLLFVWLLLKVLNIDPSHLSFPTIPSKTKYAFAAFLVLYTGITFARNFDWKDDITLFSHDIGYVDNSSQAHNLLGTHLMARSLTLKDAAEAEKIRAEAAIHFQKALDIYPDFMNASFDLGRTYSMMLSYYTSIGNKNEASRYFKLAETAYRNTMRIDSDYVESDMQLAVMLDQAGRQDEAVPLYRRVIVHEPYNIQAYTNLSFIYFQQKNYEASLAVNKQALEKMPTAHDPTVNTAKIYIMLNESDSAYVWLEKAYALDKNDRTLIEILYKMSKQKGYTDKANYYGAVLGIEPHK